MTYQRIWQKHANTKYLTHLQYYLHMQRLTLLKYSESVERVVCYRCFMIT